MTVLPDAVRARVVALGSDVLGELGPDETPMPLRPVARFASAKRARLGASAIAAAIETDARYRRRVLTAAATVLPGLVEAIEGGTVPPAADPVDTATVAYLLRPEGWEQLVEDAAAAVRTGEVEERHERELATASRVREQLDSVRAQARQSRERLKSEVARLKTENSMLRHRLQEAREKLASARSSEQAAIRTAEEATRGSETARRNAEADTRRLRLRVTEAEEALESARRVGRDDRSLANARLGLLIDTLADAATGLRRELALPASSLRPADTVRAATPAVNTGVNDVRARLADDPRLLAELLSLPQVHVVVDGYNVTKTAWPAMPLEAQRSRLIQAVASVSARTGAEVTVVFDGADVLVPPAVTHAKGVRVRFSPQGEIADELIRRLVRAEPEGRPVVVVSSDREVAEGVRRPGVRSVDAAALVGLLGR